MSHPASRRGFLRSLTIASAATATGALALPAAAAASTPHPDADLLAAFAEIERLKVEHEAARKLRSAAGRAARADTGPIPDALMLNAEEERVCRRWGRMGHLVVGYRMRWRQSREPAADGVHHQPDPAWTGVTLRRAIQYAVQDLGPAGRTPHLLRRWRGLLPIADAYDQCEQQAWLRHRTRELHDEEQRIDKAVQDARARLRSIPAKTSAGLTVHVRMFEGFSRENVPQHVLPLLLSAASVAGITVKFYEPEAAT